MSEAGPVLVATGIAKSYPSGGKQLVVLDGLDLEVKAGELVAVVGASGTGKSTLLHVVGGMDRPDRGEVWHRGRDLAKIAPQDLARFRNREVGFVFQFHFLLPEFTALENVMMPRLIGGARSDQADAEGRALLAEVGLAERGHHRPAELSGGEQQRVALARALMNRPSLVLADEPTGNLDEATSLQVWRVFEERVRERQVATVVVTHNLALARRADRVLELRSGRLAPFAST